MTSLVELFREKGYEAEYSLPVEELKILDIANLYNLLRPTVSQLFIWCTRFPVPRHTCYLKLKVSHSETALTIEAKITDVLREFKSIQTLGELEFGVEPSTFIDETHCWISLFHSVPVNPR